MHASSKLLLDPGLRTLTTAYLAYCLFLKKLEADPMQERTLIYAVRIGLSELRNELQAALEADGVVRWAQVLQHATDRLLLEADGAEDSFLALVPIRI